MRKVKFIVIVFIVLSLNAYAEKETMQEIINQGVLDSENSVRNFLVSSKDLLQEKKISTGAQSKAKKYYGEIGTMQTKYINDLKILRKESKDHNKAIQPIGNGAVFISFSIPEPSLKQIIVDAKRYHIPVVARGLYKNSMKETANIILKLTKEKNEGGILINPIWFKRYAINTVPAVLVAKDGESNSSYDVIYGNIPLKRALTLIAEKGNCAKEAEKFLTEGKV